MAKKGSLKATKKPSKGAVIGLGLIILLIVLFLFVKVAFWILLVVLLVLAAIWLYKEIKAKDTKSK